MRSQAGDTRLLLRATELGTAVLAARRDDPRGPRLVLPRRARRVRGARSRCLYIRGRGREMPAAMPPRPEPIRILVDPDGRATVVRTPVRRSARFRTLGDAERWLEGQYTAVIPMLIAAGIGAVAKAILDDDSFVPALLVILAGGAWSE